MKQIISAVLVGSVVGIIAYLIANYGQDVPSNPNPPALVQEETLAQYPRRVSNLVIPPVQTQTLPFELSEEVAVVQTYLDTKQQLLLEQLVFVPVNSLDDETFSNLETARQVDAELDRWAAANQHLRDRRTDATLKLLQNEQDLKQVIGDQKFAILQLWEASHKTE